jgi:hypothetical protein
MWFMHDGAPPHFSLVMQDVLNITCTSKMAAFTILLGLQLEKEAFADPYMT